MSEALSILLGILILSAPGLLGLAVFGQPVWPSRRADETISRGRPLRSSGYVVVIGVLAAGLSLTLLSGCASARVPASRGGSATQRIDSLPRHPAVTAAGGGEAARLAPPPAQAGGVEQSLQQPENPQGPALQSAEQVTTTIAPDGTVTTTRTATHTELGGAQDVKGILGAWARVQAAMAARYKDFLIALALGAAAWMAWRRQWPVLAATLGGGALCTLLWGATWGIGAACVGFGIYFAFNHGLRFATHGLVDLTPKS